MNRAPTRSISFLRLLRFLRLILRVSTGRDRKPALPHLSLRSMRSLRLILLLGCGSAALGPLWLILFFYCCGEVGKISDLMTTGTEPDDGINAPTSM